MIRTREELMKLNDEEFAELFKDFDKEIKRFVTKEILNQFLAYYIHCGYKMNTLSDDSLDVRINTGIEEMESYLYSKYCNKNIIKKILENDYKLKITNEDPLEIKEINSL